VCVCVYSGIFMCVCDCVCVIVCVREIDCVCDLKRLVYEGLIY